MTATRRQRVFSALKIIFACAFGLLVLRMTLNDAGLPDEQFRVSLARATDPNCLRLALETSFGAAVKKEALGRDVVVAGPTCLAKHPGGNIHYDFASDKADTLRITATQTEAECEALVREQITKAITSFVATCDPDLQSWTASCEHSGYGSRTCAPIVSSSASTR